MELAEARIHESFNDFQARLENAKPQWSYMPSVIMTASVSATVVGFQLIVMDMEAWPGWVAAGAGIGALWRGIDFHRRLAESWWKQGQLLVMEDAVPIVQSLTATIQSLCEDIDRLGAND